MHARGLVVDDDVASLQQVADRFDVLITGAMADLMTGADQDPIAMQFVPQTDELQEATQELNDPTGDQQHEVVKGVVHRYEDRCLLKVVSACPIYCRFCFRKAMIGGGKASLTKAELEKAYAYIQSQKAIWEVILTGGDPLILKPARLKAIVSKLAAIDHVAIIRYHTRVPVVEPTWITTELLAALKSSKTTYVVLHANHPSEFTASALKACAAIVDAGIPMLSQTVLLKGINDSVPVLIELMKTFVRNRIKPYYLHHPDLAKGTGHFRVSVTEGQKLVKAMQGQISGLCQPTYMLEIPGGAGKIPISPCYYSTEDATLILEDFAGNKHRYNPPVR